MRDFKTLENVLRWYYLKLPTIRTATDADLIRYRKQLESLREDAISQSMVASYEPGARPENLAPSDPVNTQVDRILRKSGETRRWIEIATQQREQLTRAHIAITLALHDLPPKHRAILYQHYHDKIQYTQLAAQRDREPQTIGYHAARALQALDDNLPLYLPRESLHVDIIAKYLLYMHNFSPSLVSTVNCVVCV